MLKGNLVTHTSQVVMISLEAMNHHKQVNTLSIIFAFFHEFRLYCTRLFDCFKHFLTLCYSINFFEHYRLHWFFYTWLISTYLQTPIDCFQHFSLLLSYSNLFRTFLVLVFDFFIWNLFERHQCEVICLYNLSDDWLFSQALNKLWVFCLEVAAELLRVTFYTLGNLMLKDDVATC